VKLLIDVQMRIGIGVGVSICTTNFLCKRVRERCSRLHVVVGKRAAFANNNLFYALICTNKSFKTSFSRQLEKHVENNLFFSSLICPEIKMKTLHLRIIVCS
jgi:hypothetical protein